MRVIARGATDRARRRSRMALRLWLGLAAPLAALGACPTTLERLCALPADAALATSVCEVNASVTLTGDDVACEFVSAGRLVVRPNVTVQCDRPFVAPATQPCTLAFDFAAGISLAAFSLARTWTVISVLSIN